MSTTMQEKISPLNKIKTNKKKKHDKKFPEKKLKTNHDQKQPHSHQNEQLKVASVIADRSESRDNPKNNNNEKKDIKNKHNNDDDWILNLVKQTTTFKSSTTKEERIQKRLQQKQRREEGRKMKQHQQQEAGTKNKKRIIIEANNDYNDIPLKLSTTSYNNLSNLNISLGSIVSTIQNIDNNNDNDKSNYKRNATLYTPIKEPKGKATKNSSYQNTTKGMTEIQPTKKDYNGLGFAKPSLYLHFRDVSFRAKYIHEFYDHVDGFNGKFNKGYSYKDSSNDNSNTMLWKKLLNDKKKQQN